MLLPKLVLLTLLLIPQKTAKVVAFISFVFSIYSIYNAIGLLSHENIFTIPGVYGAAYLYIYEAFLFLMLCRCSIIDVITGSGKEWMKMQTLRKIMSIVYAAYASYWIFVIASATIFSFMQITNSEDALTIGIIGGADIHLLPFFLPTSIFLISLLVFTVLNIIFAFREKTSLSVQWIFLIFLLANTIFFTLIPPQSHLIADYAIFRRFLTMSWTLPVSIILRLMRYTVIALTIIATIPFREEINNENIS